VEWIEASRSPLENGTRAGDSPVGEAAVLLAGAKSLGATVVRDVMEVMGEGSLSIIIDPTGATVGLWQSKAK
jgi:uncharacterized protein